MFVSALIERRLVGQRLVGTSWSMSVGASKASAARSGMRILEPLRPDYLSERFLRLVAKTDLPRIGFHDLRHTHATMALRAGVAVHVVAERLGHANSSMTLAVYAHLLPGQQATRS